MDASWPNEALSCAAQFHGLYDDLLSFDAPASKAGSQLTSREALPVTVQQVQAAEMNRKRKLELAEKESLEMFLTQLGSEEAVGISGGLVDLDAGLKRKGSDEKESKMDTARNKACRERARRERLNDRCFSRKAVLGAACNAKHIHGFLSMFTVLNIIMCRSFAELSKALDPRKDVKTDKTSIVADAIRVVTQLRAENGQLKQLNKFLEVTASRLARFILTYA